MKKPRAYKLRQCPTSTGYMQASLDLTCLDDDGRAIFISTNHDIQLKPTSARALAKRLNEMATWVEQALKGHICEDEIEKAAKKCARTGKREHLQDYLKLRRNYL